MALQEGTSDSFSAKKEMSNMKSVARITTTVTVVLSCTCLIGCPGVNPDGMEDLTTPAPCTMDSDCPDGIACVLEDDSEVGFCDVDETQVSTGAPAMCNADEDCPEGITCVLANETDANGFCDVEETLAP